MIRHGAPYSLVVLAAGRTFLNRGAPLTTRTGSSVKYPERRGAPFKEVIRTGLTHPFTRRGSPILESYTPPIATKYPERRGAPYKFVSRAGLTHPFISRGSPVLVSYTPPKRTSYPERRGAPFKEVTSYDFNASIGRTRHGAPFYIYYFNKTRLFLCF